MHEASGRLPVKILTPASQLGRAWSLRPSDLIRLDGRPANLSGAAVRVVNGAFKKLHDSRPMDKTRWPSLLPDGLRRARLDERDLAALYAGRDRRNLGCGGAGQSCSLADDLIAEAANKYGWRPTRRHSRAAAAVPDTMRSPLDYRFGDLFRWPGQFGPRSLPLYRWQPSLGFDYHLQARHDADLPLLRKLVRERPTCEPLPRGACAVHLRLGDVLEKPEVSIDALWANGTASVLSGYVFPRCYYERAIRELRASHPSVRRVIIVGNAQSVARMIGRGGHHMASTSRAVANSLALLANVRALFEARGFEVATRTDSPADCDLLLMAKLGCLVAGGGGYGGLAAALASDAGAVLGANRSNFAGRPSARTKQCVGHPMSVGELTAGLGV